mgnify:CR=1 FL=1
MREKDCPFCKIIRGEEKAEIIFEDDLVTAFLHIAPVNDGHILLVPQQHQGGASGLSTEYLHRLMEVAPKIASVTMRAVKAEGYNILLSNGACAGQMVQHACVHIIPRFPDDGVILPTFAGSANRLPPDEAKGLGQKVKRKLSTRL